jgi:hypothetical protein
LNTPSNTQTADLVGTFDVLGNIGATGRWFDTAAFAQPTGVQFGNTGRNQFYGPGGWNLDFSLFRSFPVGATRRLEYRLQAANLLNHPVFGNPSSSITSGTFGQITAVSVRARISNARCRWVCALVSKVVVQGAVFIDGPRHQSKRAPSCARAAGLSCSVCGRARQTDSLSSHATSIGRRWSILLIS